MANIELSAELNMLRTAQHAAQLIDFNNFIAKASILFTCCVVYVFLIRAAVQEDRLIKPSNVSVRNLFNPL
jgi:hypothetical protein